MRRTASERLQAWLVTGPLGHLWSVVADVGVLLFRFARARLARRFRADGT